MASSWLSAAKIAPHASMVFVQLITATYIVLSKVILVRGISSAVFLVYQFTLATVVLVALALIFERRNRPPLTGSILCWIFLLAFLGVTLTQNLFAASLYHISSTLQASVLNMVPIITFMLSIIAREEKLEIRTIWGKGKLFGTLVSVSGAFTLTCWHGSAVVLLSASSGEWMLGFAMVVGGVLAISTWILLLVSGIINFNGGGGDCCVQGHPFCQRPISIRYPAELSMNALMLFFAAIQTMLVAAITSPKASQWSIKWNLELLNIAFGAILNSGLGYLLCTWCAALKGPLFIASFSPLCLVFTTVFETAFLLQVLHISSIVGSIMVVSGVYVYLWSKAKEEAYNAREGDNALTTYILSDHANHVS